MAEEVIQSGGIQPTVFPQIVSLDFYENQTSNENESPAVASSSPSLLMPFVSAAANSNAIVDGVFCLPQIYSEDVIIKATADGDCSYPACIKIMTDDCTVTMEGGELSCDSIRNACILFGDDAYWVDTYGYGKHYNGTVTFTGAFVAFDSKVSNCITAAGIVGNTLTVNFEGIAENSAGITFRAGQGTGPGDYAAAILADKDLTINGDFAGTVVSWFDFSQLPSTRWAIAEGFGAEGSVTINGDISGTILTYVYASGEDARSYGMKAGYYSEDSLIIHGVISGTIASFGETIANALTGAWVEADIAGILIAGKAEAGKTEEQIFSLIQNTKANREELIRLSDGYYAIYTGGISDPSQISIRGNAEIYGGINMNGTLSVESGAFISGDIYAENVTISLNDIQEDFLFKQDWYCYGGITINVDDAQNGVYKIAKSMGPGYESVTIVCGSETRIWTWQSYDTITFEGGKSIYFQYTADNQLSLITSGFREPSIDTTPPDISEVTITVNTEKNKAALSWTPATDENGIAEYRVRYALVSNPENTTEITVRNEQALLSSLENGEYYVQIQASDPSGNWSAWTDRKQFTINSVTTEVLLPNEMPQAEYMYGCVPTALGMLLGYYDLYGYQGYDLSNIIPGTVSIESRGTDGNPYDMDAFDTVLGNFIATKDYVSRFYGTTPAAELPYTFVNSDPEQGLNVSVFNCLADWIGTGQYWRGNEDLSTTHYLTDLEWMYETAQTQHIGPSDIPAKYIDFKWGLDQYLQTRGYQLDQEKTTTVKADVNEGSFTFKDYAAEIDAGRPVLISIRSDSGSGHVMVGYGYDPTTETIIFDNDYENNQRMQWNGTYTYAEEDTWRLDSITTIVLNESAIPMDLPLHLSGTGDGITWDGTVKSYIVEYSGNHYTNSLRIQTKIEALDTYGMPAGTYDWHIKNSNSDIWVDDQPLTAEGHTGPELMQSDADGNGDIFFAGVTGIWDSGYLAQHTGMAGESAELYGKNQITDVFYGSTDANLLVMTDDANGDALFLDDIYSAFPASQQARLAQIDEIRAGAGDDIVDLTSQQFACSGDGLTIRGGAGNDTIWANHGDNMLFGDAGNDRLVGASGKDIIVGGTGNDSMHGGGGNDIFCFCDNFGIDTVEQLAAGTVTLWFASQKGSWDSSTLTYSDGSSSVKVSGVTADKVTLKYGDDSSEQFDVLTEAGAFLDISSEKIFEEKDKGIIASL